MKEEPTFKLGYSRPNSGVALHRWHLSAAYTAFGFSAVACGLDVLLWWGQLSGLFAILAVTFISVLAGTLGVVLGVVVLFSQQTITCFLSVLLGLGSLVFIAVMTARVISSWHGKIPVS